MSKKELLKKGTTIFFSEKGHNNFFYPTKESETLIDDTSAVFPSWVGFDNLKAALVTESSVYARGSDTKFIVVWVQK